MTAYEKAKIEAGVLVAERWILARLRHETFFSLAALNARIAELVADLNTRRMRQYQASRQELFERLDRPALRPLPTEPFLYGEWKVARVNIDYHVEVHRHYYSVPYALLHEGVDVRVSATTVEIFHRGQRLAAQVRIGLHVGDVVARDARVHGDAVNIAAPRRRVWGAQDHDLATSDRPRLLRSCPRRPRPARAACRPLSSRNSATS